MEKHMKIKLIQPAAGADLGQLRRTLQGAGLWTQPLQGAHGTTLLVEDHSRAVSADEIRALPGVADVLAAPSPHPRVDAQAHRPVALGGGRSIGGDAPGGGDGHGGGGPGVSVALWAGPCSVESEAQIEASARIVAQAGGQVLRGGAFKPRTSPYSFTGNGEQALRWMRSAADRHGLAMCTEVLGERDVAVVTSMTDIVQIGARNMQNFALLRAVGQAGMPVLLKRGMAASIDEWLLAGEHLLNHGASAVIFCERGIAGHDTHTRNLLDLAGVALLKHVYGQPVVVDPSHATGRRDLVGPLARAAAAVGADAVLIEAHPDAACARSDGPQALSPEELVSLGHALTGGGSARAPTTRTAPAAGALR